MVLFCSQSWIRHLGFFKIFSERPKSTNIEQKRLKISKERSKRSKNVKDALRKI